MTLNPTPPTIGDRLAPNPFWPIAIDAAYEVAHAAYLAFLAADNHAMRYGPDHPWRLVASQAHDLWQAAEAAAAPLVVAWQGSRNLSRPVGENDTKEARHGR